MKGAAGSRESSQPFRLKNSEEQWTVSICSLDQEARERMASRSPGEKGETPKEEKPMRVAAFLPALLVEGKDTRSDENPEVEIFGSTSRG